MILSHRHKFIFIKTEKTAGTSIEIALSKICGPEDIITPISGPDEKLRKELGYPGPQNTLAPLSSYNVVDSLRAIKRRKRLTFYNHMPAHEIKRRIPSSVWNNYYKFCFERNPFDKVISWYYWVGKEYPTILEFLKSGKAGQIKGADLYTKKGVPVVDQIYKFEALDQALEDISQKLGLDEPLQLPEKKTKSNSRKDKRPYQEVLSPEEVEWVKKIFSWELEYFDYSF